MWVPEKADSVVSIGGRSGLMSRHSVRQLMTMTHGDELFHDSACDRHDCHTRCVLIVSSAVHNHKDTTSAERRNIPSMRQCLNFSALSTLGHVTPPRR